MRHHWSRLYIKTLIALLIVSLGTLRARPISVFAYPVVTTSIYESDTNSSTLYNQGVQAGQKSTTGVVILDFGRPAYDASTNTYGTLDTINNNFHSFDSIVSAMEQFAQGFWSYSGCCPHIYLALGTNNSFASGGCSGCKDQVPSETNAGGKLADKVSVLKGAVDGGVYGNQVTGTAADDLEPNWDSTAPGAEAGGTNNGAYTYYFLSQFNQSDPSEPHPSFQLWDYGSNESGYWTNDMEYYAAQGTFEYDFGQVYTSNMAQDWENLDYWAVTAGGGYRYFWVSGVTNQAPACVQGVCLTPTQSYDTMLSKLNYNGTSSPTYQSHIDYITDI